MTATPFRENVRGIVSLSLCNLFFIVNDMMVKLASQDGLPLSELLFLRGLFATPLLVVAVLATGTQVHLPLIWNRGVFLRMVGEICAAFFYLTALLVIPFANANTIAQIAPLTITAAGAIFLAEQVGWRRWTAILVGFIGVLVVIRPGLAGFNAMSLLAVASVGFITLRDLATRLMPAALPALPVALVTAVAVAVAGAGYGLIRGDAWLAPSPHSLLLLFGAAVFIIGGYLTSIDFMRHGDISVTAPFRYSALVFAVIVGFLAWGETPDALAVLGMAIIAAAGIYTFRRERNVARLLEKADAGERI